MPIKQIRSVWFRFLVWVIWDPSFLVSSNGHSIRMMEIRKGPDWSFFVWPENGLFFEGILQQGWGITVWWSIWRKWKSTEDQNAAYKRGDGYELKKISWIQFDCSASNLVFFFYWFFNTSASIPFSGMVWVLFLSDGSVSCQQSQEVAADRNDIIDYLCVFFINRKSFFQVWMGWANSI